MLQIKVFPAQRETQRGVMRRLLQPFHGGNTGSNPVGDAIDFTRFSDNLVSYDAAGGHAWRRLHAESGYLPPLVALHRGPSGPRLMRRGRVIVRRREARFWSAAGRRPSGITEALGEPKTKACGDAWRTIGETLWAPETGGFQFPSTCFENTAGRAALGCRSALEAAAGCSHLAVMVTVPDNRAPSRVRAKQILSGGDVRWR